MDYNFENAINEWTSPPFGTGYFSTKKLLEENITDEIIKTLIKQAYNYRYGNINHVDSDNRNNKWRDGLCLDTTHDKTIIDFGCGMGLESLELAKSGNDIILADISPYNIDFSERVLQAHGVSDRLVEKVQVAGEYPFFECRNFDIFHSPGVLHHTPRAGDILRRASELLNPDGEIRIMLYSEKCWFNWFDGNVTDETDISKHPQFERYVRSRDTVGEYADWYSKSKLEKLIGDIYDIVYHDYTSSSDTFAIFRMRPKCHL